MKRKKNKERESGTKWNRTNQIGTNQKWNATKNESDNEEKVKKSDDDLGLQIFRIR